MDVGGIDEQASTPSNGDAEAHEQADPYVEKIEAAAEKFSDFKVARTLAGDLRDFVLDLVRTLPKTWAQMSEGEQTERAHAVSAACKKVVRDAVSIIETDQRVTIECLLEEVGFKPKGIVAKLGLAYADPATRHALVDAQNKEILIVVADAAQYMRARAPASIDKQQPDLPLDQTDAEHKVDDDLDTILAEDGSEQPTGQIEDRTAEREASEADPFAAGKRSALRGFNETSNPHPHPSIESAEWLRGHADGEQERLAATATSGKRRRQRGQPNGAENTST
jgi:hypothetical protein